MADIPSNIPGAPAGAVPPVKKETGKVQPKKETVRINLPPKPSAAPTIKLPTLPPGGPTGAPSAAPLTTAKTSSASTAAAPRATAAAAPAAQTRPAPAVQRAALAAAPTFGALDNILVIAALVAGLFAVGTVVWMFLILKNAIG
jgi:cytoskeletal protein RodZ